MRSLVAILSILVVAIAACSSAATATPAPTATLEPTATSRPPVNAGTINAKQYPTAPQLVIDVSKTYKATLHTNKGDITLELFPAETPITVNNFVFLARDGFYDGVAFHRVIEGFMIQGGDPRGNGTGGPGYQFEDEPVTRDYTRGIIAMANAGPNTNGSQFFVMHADYALPKNYTIFGQVTEGIETVDAIATSPVTTSARGESSVPTVELVIQSVTVIEN